MRARRVATSSLTSWCGVTWTRPCRRPVAGLSASLETSHLANLHDGVHEELRAYLLGGLALRLGDTATAVAQLEPLRVPRAVPGAAAVGRDADGGLRAQLEIRRGRPDEAARTLEEVFRLEARVGLIGGSPFYSQGLERFRYAGLLAGLGRLPEAAHWYDSFSSNSIFDLAFLAPALIERAGIDERLGRPDEAARHYRRALEVWARPDPELRPLADSAARALRRLSSGGR